MISVTAKKIRETGCRCTRILLIILVLIIGLKDKYSGQNLKEANEIAQKLSIETDHTKRANLLLNLSRAQGAGQIESALEHASRALTIFQNIKDKTGEISAYMTLGNLELLIGNDPLARSYFNKGLTMGMEMDSLVVVVQIKLLLVKTYINGTDESIGIMHLQEASDMAEKAQNHVLRTECFTALGNWYNHFSAYNTALGYLELALESAMQSGDEELIANVMHVLGNTYLKSNQHDLAYKFFENSLRKNEALGKKDKQAVLCYELGVLKLELGQQDEALIFFRNSLTLATDIGLKEYIAKGYQVLSEVYEKNHDYENAYRFVKLVNAIKGVSEISELETQIQNQRILRENQALKQREDLRDEQDERKRERFSLLLVIVILLCISMAYLFFVNQQKQKVNNELEDARISAEESEMEKEKFLTYTSHEIRTPLNAVVGVSQLLEQTTLNPKQQEYIKTIKGSANNILHIVNDVLDLSKIESGSIELALVDLPLKQLISNIINTLIFKLHNKNVSLVNDFDSNIPSNLKGDSVRVSQILLNLTDNAVKFTRSGEIRLKVELLKETIKDATIKFEVSDTGKGIRQSSLKQIFKRYEQETIHTTRNYGGTGLGLPITKQLVELMGGSIEVESTYGKGTVFRFEIKFNKSKGEEEVKKSKQIENANILYVDDNQLNRELFYDLVNDSINGVNVALAEEAKSALRLLEGKNYDLILLDIQMPRINGYELAGLIRKELGISKDNTPIYALTAYTPKDIHERCENAGMNGFLSKPINLDELNKILYKEIERKVPTESEKIEKWIKGHVNLTGLRQLVKDDRTKIIKYLKISLASFPEDLDKIKSFLDHEDWPMLGQVAHKMKSNASYMGMDEALKILNTLEKLNNQNGSYIEIAPLIDKLDDESLLALEELEVILKILEE